MPTSPGRCPRTAPSWSTTVTTCSGRCRSASPTRRGSCSGGFDADFVGYGGEDTDLAERARRLGVPLAWFDGGTAFHQWHRPSRLDPARTAELVGNAHRFRRRWGRWPMEGWLRELAVAGRRRLRPGRDVLVRAGGVRDDQDDRRRPRHRRARRRALRPSLRRRRPRPVRRASGRRRRARGAGGRGDDRPTSTCSTCTTRTSCSAGGARTGPSVAGQARGALRPADHRHAARRTRRRRRRARRPADRRLPDRAPRWPTRWWWRASTSDERLVEAGIARPVDVVPMSWEPVAPTCDVRPLAAVPGGRRARVHLPRQGPRRRRRCAAASCDAPVELWAIGTASDGHDDLRDDARRRRRPGRRDHAHHRVRRRP